MRLPDNLEEKLVKRKQEGSYRTLVTLENKIDFFSNDYLGLARVDFDSSASHGSTGSRLISGNTKKTEKIEQELANFFGQESGLLFNSGYDANLGFFSAVPQKGDTVIYDALVHASIRDGVRMSLATSYSFRHNSIAHLKEKIQRAKGNIYVAVESIYSMDGDQAPLKEIVELCEETGAYLVVDEAHSGGVYGKEGRGLLNELQLDGAVFAKIVTFGKAYGSHGALVTSGSTLRDYLINFSRPLIYTTALSQHAQERIVFAVKQAMKMDVQREMLKENIRLFCELANQYGLTVLKSESPIQGVIIPGNSKAKSLADKLLKNGIAVKAILSPTVPEGSERIRICIHSFNTRDEIKVLIETLLKG